MKRIGKRISFIFLSALLVLSIAVAFVGCDPEKTPPDPIEYTVTFNQNYTGAPAASTQTVEEGKKATKPTDPTREGYDFTGWYTDAACTTEYNFNSSVTANKTIYAGWSVKVVNVTVTFNLNYTGAPTATTQTVQEGGKATKPTDPTREGYDFTGWYTDAAGTTEYDFNSSVTANKTIYASWKVQTVVVTFNLNYNGATAPSESEVNKGATAQAPTAPTRDNYTFAGWFTDADCTTAYDFSSVVNQNITLYAKWLDASVQTVTVTFDLNYTGAPTAGTSTVAKGEKVQAPSAPMRDGYAFSGWYTEAGCNTAYDFNTIVNESKTLYAKWQEVLTVTFNLNYTDAPTAKEVTVQNGQTVSEPDEPDDIVNQISGKDENNASYSYDYAKKSFEGWYTEEALTNEYDFSTPVTTSMTLYAKWKTKYTFEAELTPLSGKTGYGYSFSLQNEELIKIDTSERNQNASFGHSVAYLYNYGMSVEFTIYSDRAVENVTLGARLSAEYRNIYMAPEDVMVGDQKYSSVQFLVNGTSVNYDPIALEGAALQGSSNHRPYDDWTLNKKVSLKEGENTIVMKVNNVDALESSIYSVAPMIDCIYLTSESELTWNPLWSNMGKVVPGTE